MFKTIKSLINKLRTPKINKVILDENTWQEGNNFRIDYKLVTIEQGHEAIFVIESKKVVNGFESFKTKEFETYKKAMQEWKPILRTCKRAYDLNRISKQNF